MSVLKFASRGILRETLDLARRQAGCTLADLTVLATQNDPFRRDTPAGHRDGQWFKEHANRLYSSIAHFHLRGIHYRLLGTSLPGNGVYENTDKCWQWLSEDAAKAARWLGYVPFTRIVDARNDEPDVIIHNPIIAPEPYCQTGLIIPDLDDIEIVVEGGTWMASQPWQIVIFGEKSSLKEPMMHFHNEYDADLYVGAGELSDTLIYNMARAVLRRQASVLLCCVCQTSIQVAGKCLFPSLGN